MTSEELTASKEHREKLEQELAEANEEKSSFLEQLKRERGRNIGLEQEPLSEGYSARTMRTSTDSSRQMAMVPREKTGKEKRCNLSCCYTWWWNLILNVGAVLTVVCLYLQLTGVLRVNVDTTAEIKKLLQDLLKQKEGE
mmetsp:Transcript_6600/g.24710  ORF Transcript_6600/g.24710 Transcript_6600/m.24710 type:complete len:140 (-) Transcript_6600:18-437(-)|eukprot:CAMPEP_0117438768 /NCGR_PEP_ID=MMETSP0759-20121206/2224_1 /TAXON_ID=63605 /ORGANISM="Percolomonas cosmopolitus, Strain WS" /LENGTH=139 /DNA_ID=CAMNT_0005230471 /DNA_START=68 /DNA_END=487 /DNA_ORIENTATION=-